MGTAWALSSMRPFHDIVAAFAKKMSTEHNEMYPIRADVNQSLSYTVIAAKLDDMKMYSMNLYRSLFYERPIHGMNVYAKFKHFVSGMNAGVDAW